MPFGILIQAVKNGLLPSNIIAKEYPPCPSCLYGKSTCRSWCTKTPHGTIAPLATKPGNCISVDQMESSIPGFVAQNIGKLTKQRFKYATIFVDQASKLGYVHVHKTTNAEDAIEAKRAFEHFVRSHGVHIKHYHADNGIFNSQEFMASVESSHQSISFCGVGAHHQSGVAEHRIRELTELARTQLLHAIHNNPKAVNKSLWPYALRHTSYLYNQFPRTGKTASPLELFTSSQVRPNLKQLHPFGCPVYFLQAPLQNRSKLPRWQERTRLGVYLGHSPYHATSVGLILSLTTGLVSPQFHCIYDNFFLTPRHNRQATSEW